MKLKQLIFVAIFIVSCFSIGFAQTDREKGIELFNKGDYKGTIKQLKNFSKKNPQDFEVLYYLGVSSIKTSKFKDAEKFLENSVAIKNDFANSLSAFAYVLILQNKTEKSLPLINKSIELDSKNAESFFILGLANFNLDDREKAIKNAYEAIRLNPNFANAYLLLAESLMMSPPRGSIIPDDSLKNKYVKISEAIGKYINLSKDLSKSKYWKNQSENVNYFAEYYKNKLPSDITGFKITKQPRANYTNNGRSSGVSGVIRLLVEFSESGKIGHILVIKNLGYGLDEQAIEAAKHIEFVPGTIDGKPVSIVRVIEYRFSVY
jgi:TonB family protein